MYNLFPSTQLKISKSGIFIKKSKASESFGVKLIKNMRGRSDKKMTTDEIMEMTRTK